MTLLYTIMTLNLVPITYLSNVLLLPPSPAPALIGTYMLSNTILIKHTIHLIPSSSRISMSLSSTLATSLLLLKSLYMIVSWSSSRIYLMIYIMSHVSWYKTSNKSMSLAIKPTISIKTICSCPTISLMYICWLKLKIIKSSSTIEPLINNKA